jgi:hypothetical protein
MFILQRGVGVLSAMIPVQASLTCVMEGDLKLALHTQNEMFRAFNRQKNVDKCMKRIDA